MDMHELLRMQTLLVETVEMQKKLLGQSARLSETRQQESSHLQQQLAQASSVLQQTAQRLEAGGQRFGQEAMRVIGDQAGQALAKGAEQKLHEFHEGIEHSTGRLAWAGKVAGEQALTLTRAQTTMVWKSLSIMAVGSLLMLGGASAWAWTKKQEADSYRIEADLLRAYNQADVTLCDGQLCAKIDKRGKKYGAKNEYVLVKPR